MLGREARDPLELDALAFGEGVADAQVAAVHHPDDVARIRLLDRRALAGEELLRRGEADGLSGARLLHLHPRFELPRADTDKCDAIAMLRVHVRLDLEHEAGERLVGRLDDPEVRLARKRRRTPIFTFVNKCDRVGEDPLKLISDVEADLGIMCHAVTWPIRRDDVFIGVYDRRQKKIHLFDRDEEHGATRVRDHVAALDSAETRELLGAEAHQVLLHDLELLDAAGHPFDEAAIAAGELSPVFFGSALTNFGVETFLGEFLELAPAPLPRESNVGLIEPTDEDFTGFVFKIQANMDPKHRDRVAFVRVCSGQFEAGMEVKQTRTGKAIRLASPQQFLARERTAI